MDKTYKEPEKALEYLQEAGVADDDDWYIFRGKIAMYQGKYQEAIEEYFEPSLEFRYKSSTPSYLFIWNCFIKLAEFDSDFYDEIFEIRPSNSTLKYELKDSETWDTLFLDITVIHQYWDEVQWNASLKTLFQKNKLDKLQFEEFVQDLAKYVRKTDLHIDIEPIMDFIVFCKKLLPQHKSRDLQTFRTSSVLTAHFRESYNEDSYYFDDSENSYTTDDE